MRMPCCPGFEQFTTGIPDTICTANNTEAVYTSVGSYALPIAPYDLTQLDIPLFCPTPGRKRSQRGLNLSLRQIQTDWPKFG